MEMCAKASKLLEGGEAALHEPPNSQKTFVIRNDVRGKPHDVYQEENVPIIMPRISCDGRCGGLCKCFFMVQTKPKKGTRTSHLQHVDRVGDRRHKPVKQTLPSAEQIF